MKEEKKVFATKLPKKDFFPQSHETARCLTGVSGATATRVVELVSWDNIVDNKML